MAHVRINPSILAADFANIEAELGRITGADFVHVDVMDNHFVPNLTLGLPVVRRIREVASLPLDVHLMIENPELWAPEYAAVGCESVTFHVEAAENPSGLVQTLHQAGIRVGVAVKPATPLHHLDGLWERLDQVLIMTVEPGFGGQMLLDAQLEKVRQARERLDQLGAHAWLQVDGGINPNTIARTAAAGADTFVAGSAVFGSPDPAAQIRLLRELAGAARASRAVPDNA